MSSPSHVVLCNDTVMASQNEEEDGRHGGMKMMRAYEFVTNTPVRLDEHRGMIVQDVAMLRTSPPLSPPIKASCGEVMIERCVVVQRGDDGYGFTVRGENPVYVETLRPGGPAYCAGVRQGDRILKVNGMPVTAGNQQEVVRMISGGQNVVLTLIGRPPEPMPMHVAVESRTESLCEHTPCENAGWKRRQKEILSQRQDDLLLQQQQRREEPLQLKRVRDDVGWARIATNSSPCRSAASLPTTLGTMEPDSDDDINDYALPVEEGPFSNVAQLKAHPVQMAVFINHLLSTYSANSLFYYLVTDLFQSAHGQAKEFRRWSFEIFTTFIIPNSPLVIPNSDQTIIQPIDKMLSTTAEHLSESDVETFKRLFVPGRQRAIQDINDHLNEFRAKYDSGCANIPDIIVSGRKDPEAEKKIAEQMLFRAMEAAVATGGDFDQCDLRTQAVVCCLATIIKSIVPKPSNSTWEKMLDKFPQFIQKERTKPRKPPGNAKSKTQVKGHSFVYNMINTVHYCYQCRDAVWGIQPWCYFCNNCDVKVHAQCTSSLVDACYPATQVKSKINKFRKPGVLGRSDGDDDDRTDHNVKSTSSDSGLGQELHDRSTSIGRSQSARGGRVAALPQFIEEKRTPRKERLPVLWAGDLPPADEDDDVISARLRCNDNSESRLTDYGRSVADVQSVSDSSGVSHMSFPDSEVMRMVERIGAQALADGDSDLEVESETPPIDQLVGWDVVKHMKPKEKKRQDFINELFHTERTHVRNLKILSKLFYQPMLANNIISPEVLHLLFANLDQLIQVHSNMSHKMREAAEQFKKDPLLAGPYGNIGHLVESLFDGEQGERLMQVTSTFCQHQQHALETLRSKSKKDREDGLVKFLTEAESHPICRKLQLKDMIPVEMQRLVKYPLLLEGIAKYTQEPSEEQDCVTRAVAAAKRILIAVNTAKRTAENLRRLEDLQRRMDSTPFDKENIGSEYAHLDLTKYQLVHDGPLTCRFSRGKMVELHVVLLDDNVVLLTRYNDGNKLLLKSLEPSKETKLSPILNLSSLIAKEKANDKRAFFLVINTHNKGREGGAQILELQAATATERKTWFKLMSDQIENYKKLRPQSNTETCNYEYGVSNSDDGTAKVHVLTHPRLVNASEITVQQPTIFEHAQPVLTPIERLKRSDQTIFQALQIKHGILAQYLPGDKKGKPEELDKLTEILGGMSVTDLKQRDGRELAMSAIVHGNRLLDSINSGMNAHKEPDESNPGGTVLALDDCDRNLPSVPCYKLTAIAAPLMNHLKALMQVIQDQQAELNTVKQQLYHYKELAECGPRDRSVSEETLTDADGERKLITRRQRAPSIQPI